MDNPIINPKTTIEIDSFVKSPGHALLVIGPAGIGKSTIVNQLALKLLGSDKASANEDSRVFWIAPDGKGISIDSVRSLLHFVSLKSVGASAISRVAVIEDAHTMSTEAQNAMLKLIEEPPTGCIYILTATNKNALLPTLVSRMRILSVTKPNMETLIQHFTVLGYSGTDINRAYSMASGLPGLMSELLSTGDGHPLNLAAALARQVLQSDNFERQCLVDRISKDRQLSLDICDMLGQMSHIALRNGQKGTSQERKWQSVMSKSLQAGEDLRNSAQTKLVLTSCFLQI